MGRMGSVLGNVSIIRHKAGEVNIKVLNATLRSFHFILHITKK